MPPFIILSLLTLAFGGQEPQEIKPTLVSEKAFISCVKLAENMPLANATQSVKDCSYTSYGVMNNNPHHEN